MMRVKWPKPIGASEMRGEGSQRWNLWTARLSWIPRTESARSLCASPARRTIAWRIPDVSRLATFVRPLRGRTWYSRTAAPIST